MSQPARDAAFLAPTPVGPVEAGPRPTFSVVVAAWKAATTIEAAVRSALEQTEPPLEVVVCDDGSPDDVAGALAPLADRVRLVRIPHSGASAARNAAAATAVGDFVAILDADDTWEPSRLERLADLASARPDLDLLTTDAWFVVDGRRAGRFSERAGAFPTVAQATEILRRNFFFAHVAVRRSVWERLGGFAPEVAYADDWDFWLRALFAGCRAGCVAEPLADYTIHAGSVSADRAASLNARVLVLDRAETQPLSPSQRVVLAEARREHLRRARLAGAERALLDGTGERRRASLAVVRTPGVSLRARLLAGAAVVAPGLARRRLLRERAATGRARSDRVHGSS